MAKLGKKKLYGLAAKILKEKEEMILPDMKECVYRFGAPVDYLEFLLEGKKVYFQSVFGGERGRYIIKDACGCTLKYSTWISGNAA